MDLNSLLLVAPVLLFSMVAHEYAHGYAALRQGDPTAMQLGRLTWNPLPHIDLMMTIVVPLLSFYFGGFIFGGAKPVPVDARNFREYKKGDIIVSLAGVATNLVIAAISAMLFVPLGLLGGGVPALQVTCAILQQMLIYSVLINIGLAAFNLLPIPPLDGSHVFKYLLPPAWSLQYQRIGQFGFLVLFAFLSFGRPLLSAWMTPAYATVDAITRVIGPYELPVPWRQ